MRPKAKLGGVLLACCLATVLSPSRALAARLLEFYIERNGETVLHTFYDDDGRADAATVWGYWRRPPERVIASRVQPDADDPLRATVEGDVLLKIVHGRGTIGLRRVSTLTLIRKSVDTEGWFLPTSGTSQAIGSACSFR